MISILFRQSHRFLIADEDEGELSEVKNQLEAEQMEHGDLIYLHGFVDKYKHLHLKMYGGFLWQQHYCPNVEWLLKADDDTVVHLGQLDYWIKHKFRRIAKKHAELIYFGRVLYGSKPHRDPKSKSYVPKSVYSKDEYPSYMSGAVYLTTTKTIAAILPRAAEIVAFHIDDALFTGILADLVNATRSLQKQHILRVDLDGDATCENGMSTAIAIFFWWEWKGAERSNEHYQCLKSWKSKCG